MRKPLTETEKAELNKPKPPSKSQLKKIANAEKKERKKQIRQTKRQKTVKFDSLKQIEANGYSSFILMACCRLPSALMKTCVHSDP